MTFDEAKKLMEQGGSCHPDYFGPGWTVIKLGGHFFDVNPVTGSQLLHTMGTRDETATWGEGKAPGETAPLDPTLFAKYSRSR